MTTITELGAAPEQPKTRWLATVGEFVRVDVRTTIIALAVGGVVWQLFAAVLDKDWFPTFWTVQQRSIELLEDPVFRDALWDSLRDLVVGYLVSVVIGLTVGLAMGMNRLFDEALNFYVDALLFIPPVVTVPIFLSIFGLSRTAILALIVLFAAPIIAVTTRSAIGDVDRPLLEAARSFGATRRQLITLVLMRSSLPGIFTGLHLGMGRAVKGMIIGQLILAVIGIGAYEARFQRSFDAVGLWSIALIVVGVAIVFSWLVLLGDRIVNSWAYVGQR